MTMDPMSSSRGWLYYVSDLHLLLLFALVLRIIFIYLGCFLDRYAISYTDVDYHVFTDAADFIVQGKSPYERFGYRYPPVIGLLLVPGVYYDIPILGKVLFSLFDVFNVYMIYQIINSTKIIGDDNNNNYKKKNISVLLALSWAINPLAINICTRGNADSVTNFIALTLLYLIQVKRNNFLSGILYGFLVYFRIYPIIYSLPIVLFIWGIDHTSAIRDIFSFHNAYKLMHFFHSALAMMLICTSLSYSIYGDQYLSDALYYHAQRYDFRHNFSPHFYLIYLNSDTASITGASHVSTGALVQTILKLVPLALLILAVSVRYAKSNLPLALLLVTMIFVTYNTVCTAQYFMWYICFIPIIVSQRMLKSKKRDWGYTACCTLTLAWIFALGVWLYHAYHLEMLGENTFLLLFASSILFHATNVAIVIYVIMTSQY